MKNAKCLVCCTKNNTSKQLVEIIKNIKRLRCKNCGCIFFETESIPEVRYDMKYNMEFFRPSDIRKAGLKAYEISEKLKNDKGRHNILEIGPGNGLFTMLMQVMGWQIKAVEIESSTTLYLRKNIHINIENKRFENYKENEKFSFIYASHVIEHSKKPVDFVKKAYKILKTRGILYIETPDANCQEKQGTNWKALRTRSPWEHTAILTEESINILAEKSKLRILMLRKVKEYDAIETALEKIEK